MDFIEMVPIIIFILGLFGFWVARHIRKHKVAGKPLVCPIKFDCHTVVHSDYSRFFGIPVEILGMAYYGAVFVFYFASFILPGFFPDFMTSFMMLLSLVAFLFSAYLISVQIFILKKGCSWCIVSAFICLLIIILTAII